MQVFPVVYSFYWINSFFLSHADPNSSFYVYLTMAGVCVIEAFENGNMIRNI